MSDSFIINSSINDGYPSFGVNFPNSLTNKVNILYKLYPSVNNGYPSYNRAFPTNTQDKPYPVNMFAVYDNILDEYPSFNREFPENAQDSPYPINMFSTYNNDYPSYNRAFPTNTQDRPYPISLYSIYDVINNEYPCFGRKFGEPFGCFQNAINLSKIKIPRSVKEVCDYAYYNTNIIEATIARDCIIFPNSFPEGCKIKYYD